LGGQFRPNFDVRETPSGRKILNEQRSVCESLLARARASKVERWVAR
jgi:hypothetical protein